MSKHNKIGIKGEQIASDFLLKKGYIIVANNWRCGRKEIDIIAAMGDLLAVVEVKTRTTTQFTFPEEAVNKKKQNNLKVAAHSFAETHPEYKHIRYDIISILFDGNNVKEIVHFEEAFH